jgi:hypothetical protein
MQAVHFTFGVGAFIAPLALASFGLAVYWGFAALCLVPLPFLLWYSSSHSRVLEPDRSQSDSSSDEDGVSMPPQATATRGREVTAIGADDVTTLPSSSSEQENPAGAGAETLAADSEELAIVTSGTASSTIKHPIPDELTALVACFLMMYAGVEVGFGGWITSVAVLAGWYDATDAAYLSAAFWGAITLGRGAAIFVSMKCSSSLMLKKDVVSALFCALLLAALFGGAPIVNQTSDDNSTASLSGSNGTNAMSPWLWILTGLFGFSLASAFPSAISLPKHLGFDVSERFTSFSFIGATGGEMILPVLIGEYIHQAFSLVSAQ